MTFLTTLQSIDTSFLTAIRSLAFDSYSAEPQKWAVIFVRFFADIEVFATVLGLVFLWLFGVYKKDDSYKITALQSFYTIGIAFVFYTILNNILPVRPRPEDVTAIAPLIAHIPDNSFPSGHAIFASASSVAAFFFISKKSVGWTLVVLGIIMCFARILAGVHYPGDILVGFIVGSILAYVTARWGISKIKKDSPYFQFLIRIAQYFKL